MEVTIKSDFFLQNRSYRKEYLEAFNDIYSNQCFSANNQQSKVPFKRSLFKRFITNYLVPCFTLHRFSSPRFRHFLYVFSIFLRLLCVLTIIYTTLIMIHEIDSWLPLLSLISCLGIFCDMIYFIRAKKEHTGFNLFLLFYCLGMIPAIWMQHEIISSLITKYSTKNVTINPLFIFVIDL
jgi:hypothetical protein